MSSGPDEAPSGPGGGGQDCSNQQGAGALLLCLISDPFAQQFKATAIWTALGTSLGFMILIMLAFSLIRPRNSVVYAPRLKFADDKHAPPPIGKGIFDWTPPLLKLHEADLKDRIGLDATIFLRFTRMCRNLFAVVTIVSCGLILPANLISGSKSKEAKAFHTQGFWSISTPQYTQGNTLWVHVVAAWLINIIVVFFLWRNYVAVTRLKRAYYESPEYLNSLHSRTLILTDIPPVSRSDEGILRLTDEVEQTSSIPRAAIARNVRELPELIEQHDKAVKELESVLAKYLKNPDKPPAKRPTMKPSRNVRRGHGSERADSINYLIDRIQELEMEIKHMRKSVDKRNPLAYGFASYDKIEEAHTVAYAAKKKHPQGATIRLAPKPTDIIWKNMALTKKERSWKRFVNNFWVVILTVVWIAPNAMIAVFLSNLSNLANVWKGFNASYQKDPKGWAIVQGIASPALTSLIYVLLPIAFRRMSNRAGDLTKSSRERHVATRLYSFFVFNNLVVFSVFSAIWAYVTTIINKTKEKDESVWDAIREGYFFQTLLGGLIEVTPFWITWLLQRNLGSAADLAQIIQLTWIWFGKTFTSPTPRQRIELTAPCAFDYAIYYNYFLFYSTVALCFTTLQPLVIPITAFYFTIDYWLKKYLLLYVLITKHESGGQAWRILFNRMLFAIILADFVIAAVLKASGSWTMIFVMVPMPIALVGFKFWCARKFDDECDFYSRGRRRDYENMADPGKMSRRSDRLAQKFGHPALISKLMTPMVHANAAHALSQIYRGRGVTDPSHLDNAYDLSPPATEFGDVAMDPMSQTYPGKNARFSPDGTTAKSSQGDLFEYIPENKLDFGYYKNRAEFAEEYGGDGELFGRPLDLISERSSTPRSFMGRHGSFGGSGSPGSSRASSPGPLHDPYARSRIPSAGAGVVGLMQPGSFHNRANSSADFAASRRGGSSGSAGPGFGPVGGAGHFHRGSDAASESETNLLRSAQGMGSGGGGGYHAPSGPVPYAPDQDPSAAREQYGLRNWRPGGGPTGYAGIPGGEADFSYHGGSATHSRNVSGSGYEAYRR